jgi:hypothetical protein
MSYGASASNLTLSGKKQSSNLLKLSGKNTQPILPAFIQEIEINIMNNIIIPMVNSHWAILKQNLFLVELLKPRLALYYAIYKLPELLVYQNALTICSNVLNEHIQLADLEKAQYGASVNNMTNIVYKTSMINLKPDYSLYNMILGRPDFAGGERYNQDVLDDIRRLLTSQNVNYNIISAFIMKKFAK